MIQLRAQLFGDVLPSSPADRNNVAHLRHCRNGQAPPSPGLCGEPIAGFGNVLRNHVEMRAQWISNRRRRDCIVQGSGDHGITNIAGSMHIKWGQHYLDTAEMSYRVASKVSARRPKERGTRLRCRCQQVCARYWQGRQGNPSPKNDRSRSGR